MARTQPNEAEAEAIRDLIHRSVLNEIDFHEVGARKLAENKQRESNENQIDVSMQVKHHVSEGAFGILFVVVLHPFKGEIEVSVAAEYIVEDDDPIDEHAVRAFGNEVAVMTLFPYVREAVSTLTARLWQKPITMPTLERGAVGFDLDEKTDSQSDSSN